MSDIVRDAALTLVWALVGALSMGAALALVLRLFSALTPINEWDEIKKGNLAVAIVLAAVLLATALVVAVAILPGGEK